MHRHYQRDQHIIIDFDNLHPQLHNGFAILPSDQFSNWGTEYEMQSVMHYPDSMGSIDPNRPVIIARNSALQNQIGGQNISIGDVTRINNMYRCRI